MDTTNLHLNLFLIRHAQPQNPPDHWTAPSSPLSDQGIIQAKELARNLKNHLFDKLISSPFLRTTKTAEIIRQSLNSKIEVQNEKWLAEIDLGTWAGMHKSQISSDPRYPKFFPKDKATFQEPLVARLMNTNKEFTFPGGESLETFWNRVQTGFLQLMNNFRNNGNQTIGLVGHGGSFSVITSILLGNTFFEKSLPIIAIEMAKFAHIRIYKGRVVFVKLN